MGKRTARWARAHRARLGLTQPQLAEAAGISLSTVTRLERGSPVRDYAVSYTHLDVYKRQIPPRSSGLRRTVLVLRPDSREKIPSTIR